MVIDLNNLEEIQRYSGPKVKICASGVPSNTKQEIEKFFHIGALAKRQWPRQVKNSRWVSRDKT